MTLVTEEEYSLIEEIFLPDDRGNETRMSGTTFITLYNAIRKRVKDLPNEKNIHEDKEARKEGVDGLRFLLDFFNRHYANSGRQGEIQTAHHQSEDSSKMDGIKFLWYFFSRNLAGQIDVTVKARNDKFKPNNSVTSQGRILIKNMMRKAKQNAIPSPASCSSETDNTSGMTGIRFLWTFFSQNLPLQMEISINRRNEEVKNSHTLYLTGEKYSVDKFLRNTVIEEQDDDVSSRCSSISFVTTGSTSSNSLESSVIPNGHAELPRSPRVLARSTPIPPLGSLDRVEEGYLETPSSSCDGDNVNDDNDVFPRLDQSSGISWVRAHDYFEKLRDFHLNRAEEDNLPTDDSDSFANLLPENSN